MTETEKRVKERRKKMMEYIKFYKRTHDGIPPTVREMQNEVGASSTSMVADDLRALEKEKKISTHRGMVMVVGGKWGMQPKHEVHNT